MALHPRRMVQVLGGLVRACAHRSLELDTMRALVGCSDPHFLERMIGEAPVAAFLGPRDKSAATFWPADAPLVTVAGTVVFLRP